MRTVNDSTFRPQAEDLDVDSAVVTTDSGEVVINDVDESRQSPESDSEVLGVDLGEYCENNVGCCSSKVDESFRQISSCDGSDQLMSKQRKQLSKLYVRYRKTDRLVENFKKEIDFLTQEISAVTGMLTRLAVEEKTLDSIRTKQLHQLEELLAIDSEAVHANLKKKESLFYRRYSKANSGEELTMLMTSIRQRQTALKHLELLTYRKILNLKSSAKKKPRLLPKPAKFTQMADSTDDVTEFHVNRKSELPGFVSLPWTWGNTRTGASLEWKWEPPKQNFLASQV